MSRDALSIHISRHSVARPFLHGGVAMNRRKKNKTAGAIVGTQCGDRSRKQIVPDVDESPRYDYNNPGFEGEYEFDLTVEMLGQRMTRRAKAKYAHTPHWAYFDLKMNAAPFVVKISW